jgi:hypothetical protein
MNGRRVAGLVGLLALSTVAAAQTPRQDGLWKVQIQMSMPNMPMQLPPITTEQCVTPEDLKDPMRTVPQPTTPGSPEAGQCKTTDFQNAGDKITWKMECTGGTPMSGAGELVYSGDTYAGTMTMTRQGQTMTAKINGVRLGDCTR